MDEAGVFDLVLDGGIAPRYGADISPPPVYVVFPLMRIVAFPQPFQSGADLTLVVRSLLRPLWNEDIEIGCSRDEVIDEGPDYCLA